MGRVISSEVIIMPSFLDFPMAASNGSEIGEVVDTASIPADNEQRKSQPLPLQLRRRVGAFTACVALGFVDYTCALVETHPNSAIYREVNFVNSQVSTENQTCPAPSKTALSAAEKLMAEPQDPNFEMEGVWANKQRAVELIRRTMDVGVYDLPLHTKHHHFSSKIGAEMDSRIQHDIAREYKQTVYDKAKFKAEMDSYDMQTTPFSAYLNIAQAYMRQFGVEIRIGNANENYAYSLYEPDSSDLETVTAKQNMGTLIETFSAMTKQYVAMSGLKTIVLADGRASKQHKKGADAVAYAGGGIITADITSVWNEDLFRHESSHLVQRVVCGSDAATKNDPAYVSLNGGWRYGRGPDYEDDMASGWMDNLQSEVITYENSNNIPMACKAWQEIKRQLAFVKFLDSNARTNVVEDEADVGEIVTNPYEWDMVIDDPAPAVQKKFIVWFARIIEHVPGSAEYFAAMADREPELSPCDPANPSN